MVTTSFLRTVSLQESQRFRNSGDESRGIYVPRKIRVFCAIDFPRRVVFVKFIGTHADYDRIDAVTVTRSSELTMDIRPVRSNEDHRAALEEIDRLSGAPVDSDDGHKLDILVALVERYEEVNFALPRSNPLDVVKFVMRETATCRPI